MQTARHRVSTDYAMGWDVGGAHLKACLVSASAEVIQVWHLPCPMWQGLDKLHGCLQQVIQSLQSLIGTDCVRHAFTMTAELVDLFDSRSDGVTQIAKVIQQWIPSATIYAGYRGCLDIAQAPLYANQIASANWMVSGQWLAQYYPDVLLVDIGSTTTDFIVIREGQVINTALHDAQRLQCHELLYTGVVRTPLMALGPRIEWQGKETNIAAEYFATSADVYRLTGELSPRHDVAATADGKDKSVLASSRRLARMVGADVADYDAQVWLDLARNFRAAQIQLLQHSLQSLVDRHHVPAQVDMIGVGAGAFLVQHLAHHHQRDYLSIQALISVRELPLMDMVLLCFPAFALASIAIR